MGDLAVLRDPDSCGSESHCVDVCDAAAIGMEWAPAEGRGDIGKWLHAKTM
jgi:hypothetical protein